MDRTNQKIGIICEISTVAVKYSQPENKHKTLVQTTPCLISSCLCGCANLLTVITAYRKKKSKT